MRPRLVFAIALVGVAGCGGASSPAPRKMSGEQAECVRLEREIRARLGPQVPGSLAGQYDSGCSAIRISGPLDSNRPADHPAFNRVIGEFETAAAHRVPNAVGASCRYPGAVRRGTILACSVTLQGSRHEPHYAVRVLGRGCWRAISLDGGADLRGCR